MCLVRQRIDRWTDWQSDKRPVLLQSITVWTWHVQLQRWDLFIVIATLYFALSDFCVGLPSKKCLNKLFFLRFSSQLGRGCGTSKHSCLVSYLLCWLRHVSATVGHLQVTKMYIEENYTEYDHSESYVYWTVHHLVSWINWTNLMSFYESFLSLNMFRMLLHSSSGAGVCM